MSRTADVVIIGAGIAGVSTAYHLAVRHGVSEVVVVDARPPLSLTSDKSTECYRNWWPSSPMVELMNRSIDILDELAGEVQFGMNRRGYLFVTAREPTLVRLASESEVVARIGADSDLLDPNDLRSRYPFVTSEAVGGLWVPRAGWFNAQVLGQWLLDRARDRGTEVVTASVTAIAGTVALSDGSEISTPQVVIAAGPLSADVGRLAGLELPLHSELHLKVTFKDHLRVIPRDAPMTIWSDPQRLDWDDEERKGLVKSDRGDLTAEMPVFCHFRPEGGADSPYIVGLWEYHGQAMDPVWPLPEDPMYPEVVMRGLTTMVPGLSAYRDRLPESFVDGGYYTKTVENRPLIGPSPRPGVHLMTGMSGFGVMVSQAAADLLATYLAGGELPGYAAAFLLDRYRDPDYLQTIEDVPTGQL